MLRGPQTVGELRGRTERMHEFADIEEVERCLETLAAREPDPLVAPLPRGRWAICWEACRIPANEAATSRRRRSARGVWKSRVAALEARSRRTEAQLWKVSAANSSKIEVYAT